MPSYKIMKYFQAPNKKARCIRTGLSEQDAKDFCKKESSHGDGWFYGYTVE